MSGEPSTDLEHRPDHLALRLDAACDRFEAAWREGRRPRIEDFLGEVAERERTELLRLLLGVELELRRGAGEDPTPDEYWTRFPEHLRVITEAFAEPRSRSGAERTVLKTSAADYNLLFGILALQNSFVSRDALVDALNAWVADKSRPLREVLRDRGQLDSAHGALLEALAQVHLKLHGGDAQQSLAALSSLGSAREMLQRIADPDLQGGLSRTSVYPFKDSGAGATPTFGTIELASGMSRFRILRPHAKGGLGEVFVAADDELHREVALKRIQPGRADDHESRTRFVLEAEITGNLEHPGIVPVYGLGHYANGRPFYAMRFVQGESLKAAIARFHAADIPGRDPGERALALRGLLGRFIDVCDAIAYAHSRSVLHRDLKPGNIMLGNYGETLVVDWGLAKVAGPAKGEEGSASPGPVQPHSARGSASTVAGIALGTPGFMSPEQAAGDLDRLGPQSDVYSLGATLYCLLAGRAPLESGDGDVEEVLRRAQAGELTPPRQVKREVPPALEAVCLKAMALRGEDRYATARGLAQEIEHWLADEPVSAWLEPWPVRVRRWAKRHRTMVAAAAAACAAALLLGGIGLYSYQRQLRQETVRTSSALDRAEQARIDARAAWSERLDATGWGRAEDLASAAVALDSRRLPTGVRRRMQALSEGVKVEAGESRADAALLYDLAAVRAARNDPLFDAPSEYGRALQKRGLPVEVGDPAATAARLRGRPVPVAVQIASYLDDWTLLLRDKGGARNQADWITALARALDPDPWRNALRDALSLPERAERRLAVSRLAVAPDVEEQPSPTITLLAAALREAGESGPAIGLLEPARFRHPKDPWIHQELGLALLAVRPPRRDDALRAFTASTTLRPEMGFELAKALSDTGRTVEAISRLEDVAGRQPAAWYFHWLGEMKAGVGRTDESVELYRRAVALSRSRVDSGVDDFDTHMQLGVSLFRLEDLAAAVPELREATRLKPDSASAHNNLGIALGSLSDRAGAVAAFREAIRLKPDFAEVWKNLGLILDNSGDRAGAIVALREAIRLKPDFAMGHDSLGVVLLKTGDRAGAVAECREATRLKPDDSHAHFNLGVVLHDCGDRAGTVAAFREAIRNRPNFFQAHNYLGMTLCESGNLAGAVAALREAIRLKPDAFTVHHYLGGVLLNLGDRAGAIVAFRDAIRLKPDFAPAHDSLGVALQSTGDLSGAFAAYRAAIRLKPDFAPAHSNLGLALLQKGDLGGATVELREAIRLRPDHSEDHFNLGLVLYDSHDLAGAIVEHRAAIRFKPDFFQAHNSLGAALQSTGDLGGAFAAYRAAIRLKPDFAPAHSNLGLALLQKGDLGGAIVELREAVRLDPNNPKARNNLGGVLRDSGDQTGAVANFQEAVRLKPVNPEAHCNLGHALRDMGRFREALVAIQRGHEQGERQPRWQYPSATWVTECQREIELEGKLPKILSGQDRPAGAAERAELASVAGRKGLHAAAARFFAAAFAERPALADNLDSDPRYDAARYAALAGCGKVQDEPPTGPAERARLRAQALGWLKADRAAWAEHLDGSPTKTRAAMSRWRNHADLAGVRVPEELARLSEPERQEWQALWTAVETLEHQAEDRAARPPGPPSGELPADPFAH
jgi:Flp pilus assembly protein TadD/tRNA A-37 threonylcarbamoyl transferase component Bud32